MTVKNRSTNGVVAKSVLDALDVAVGVGRGSSLPARCRARRSVPRSSIGDSSEGSGLNSEYADAGTSTMTSTTARGPSVRTAALAR